jgi:hypothetical protein
VHGNTQPDALSTREASILYQRVHRRQSWRSGNRDDAIALRQPWKYPSNQMIILSRFPQPSTLYPMPAMAPRM